MQNQQEQLQNQKTEDLSEYILYVLHQRELEKTKKENCHFIVSTTEIWKVDHSHKERSGFPKFQTQPA